MFNITRNILPYPVMILFPLPDLLVEPLVTPDILRDCLCPNGLPNTSANPKSFFSTTTSSSSSTSIDMAGDTSPALGLGTAGTLKPSFEFSLDSKDRVDLGLLPIPPLPLGPGVEITVLLLLKAILEGPGDLPLLPVHSNPSAPTLFIPSSEALLAGPGPVLEDLERGSKVVALLGLDLPLKIMTDLGFVAVPSGN